MSGCYLYIAAVVKEGRPTAPVKVGISSNPWSRVYEMQTGSPARLTILHALWLPTRELALENEHVMHMILSDRSVHGEWFDVDPFDALQEAIGVVDVDLWRAVGDVPLFLYALREKVGVNKAIQLIERELQS